MDTDDGDLLGWEFDESAQYDPAWSQWVLDSTIAAKMDALFTRTLPSVPQRPWWLDRGLGNDDDVWVPMPDCGRYDVQMMDWISDMAFEWFFPDEESLSDPTKFDIADQFVTYIGQCFVSQLGASLFNAPGAGSPLYDDIGPAGLMIFAEKPVYLVDELLEAANEGFFSVSRTIATLLADKERDERVFGQ